MHSNYKHACAVAEGRMMKNDQKNKQYITSRAVKTRHMFIALRVTPSTSCQQLEEALAVVREIKADQLDNK